MSRNVLARNVRRGWMRPVHRGVYAIGHRPLSWRARWLAAVLACGRGGGLSHLAAGALWELGPKPGVPIDVTVVTAGRPNRPGIRVHRARTLPLTTHHGIPVTTPARTLLDLAATLPRRRLERVIDEAQRLRLCDVAALDATLAAERGRPGTRALAAVLAEHRIGSSKTRSELEEYFMKLCRNHDLPPPLINEELPECTPDFLWPDAQVIVEVDGRDGHTTLAAFQEDRARDARLTAAGYRCLRFTYRDVLRDPAVVASRIRNVRRLGLLGPGP